MPIRITGRMDWWHDRDLGSWFLAVDYLHKAGVVHGGKVSGIWCIVQSLIDLSRVDIHTGNVLFTLPALDGIDLMPDVVTEIFGNPTLGAVIQCDVGERGPVVPEYLVMPVQVSRDHRGSCHKVPLIDLAEAFFIDRCSFTSHTARKYKPPELVFGLPITKAVDIWNLACMVISQTNRAQFPD